MEKYGVDEQNTAAKTAAADKDRCPDCGAKLEPTNTINVLKCPRCGTRPFERTE